MISMKESYCSLKDPIEPLDRHKHPRNLAFEQPHQRKDKEAQNEPRNSDCHNFLHTKMVEKVAQNRQ